MGCNVEKAKLEIYEILVKDQKKSDEKIEKVEKVQVNSNNKEKYRSDINNKNSINILIFVFAI